MGSILSPKKDSDRSIYGSSLSIIEFILDSFLIYFGLFSFHLSLDQCVSIAICRSILGHFFSNPRIFQVFIEYPISTLFMSVEINFIWDFVLAKTIVHCAWNLKRWMVFQGTRSARSYVKISTIWPKIPPKKSTQNPSPQMKNLLKFRFFRDPLQAKWISNEYLFSRSKLTPYKVLQCVNMSIKQENVTKND